MNIYEIEEELKVLLNELEEREGIVDDEFWEQFLTTQETFKAKLTNYCKVIRMFDGQIENAQTEIKRIQNYIRIKNTTVERLEKIVVDALKQFGEKDAKKAIWRMELETFKLGTRSSVSVEIYDEDLIDDKFKRLAMGNLSLDDKVKILDALGKSQEDVKISIDILKTLIKEAIIAGEVVEGAKLETKFGLNLK